MRRADREQLAAKVEVEALNQDKANEFLQSLAPSNTISFSDFMFYFSLLLDSRSSIAEIGRKTQALLEEFEESKQDDE